MEAVLRGYDAVASMTVMEKKAMPFVYAALEIVCIASFQEYGYPLLVEPNIAVLKYLLNHFGL